MRASSNPHRFGSRVCGHSGGPCSVQSQAHHKFNPRRVCRARRPSWPRGDHERQRVVRHKTRIRGGDRIGEAERADALSTKSTPNVAVPLAGTLTEGEARTNCAVEEALNATLICPAVDRRLVTVTVRCVVWPRTTRSGAALRVIGAAASRSTGTATVNGLASAVCPVTTTS